MTGSLKTTTPWNLGLKVRDLDRDLAFLQACGAHGVAKGSISSPEGEQDFGMAFLGEQRLLLFPRVIYENALDEPLHFGLTHAVFEVESLEEVLAMCDRNGVRPLWGPEYVSTPFGRRRIAFFRSPSNLIFETFEKVD